jgi:hypothetical protein
VISERTMGADVNTAQGGSSGPSIPQTGAAESNRNFKNPGLSALVTAARRSVGLSHADDTRRLAPRNTKRTMGQPI